MLSYLDVTYLEDNVNGELEKLIEQIKANPSIAGVCVYLAELSKVKKALLHLPLSFVTVANFPHGNDLPKEIIATLQQAKKIGANEVDVVIPIRAFLEKRDPTVVGEFIDMCRQELPSQTLKVILETGALTDEDIYRLSVIACEKGADFIKTSTGKAFHGATPMAVQTMMRAIKEHTAKKVGLKISGGIRTPEQAQAYIDLVKAGLGETWLVPHLFRIGASALFQTLITT